MLGSDTFLPFTTLLHGMRALGATCLRKKNPSMRNLSAASQTEHARFLRLRWLIAPLQRYLYQCCKIRRICSNQPGQIHKGYGLLSPCRDAFLYRYYFILNYRTILAGSGDYVSLLRRGLTSVLKPAGPNSQRVRIVESM